MKASDYSVQSTTYYEFIRQNIAFREYQKIVNESVESKLRIINYYRHLGRKTSRKIVNFKNKKVPHQGFY